MVSDERKGIGGGRRTVDRFEVGVGDVYKRDEDRVDPSLQSRISSTPPRTNART